MDPATLEAQPGVFGAGDVTGLGGFTHLAYYHGQVIARRLRGMDARADHTAVPRVTFTDPEIASVGLSEAAARARGIDVVVASADPAETARGYIHDFHRGALKLVGDRERGVLIGATLVTPRAGEIVGELVLAIKLGTPLKTLADVIHPFPAFNRVLGESLDELAAKALQREHHTTEVTMSSTQTSNEHATQIPTAATVDLKLEVVVIPVSDVDRAKRFYEGLGWRLDADFAGGDELARGAVHTSRLAVLDPLRQGHHDGRAGLSQESLSRRVRHRGGTRGAHRPRRRGERGVPFRRLRRTTRAGPRPRTVAPTQRSPRSAIRTATAGCSRRSRRGFPDEDSATWTSRR